VSTPVSSILGDRSFVDPVSNAVLLAPIDLESELGNIVQLKLPTSCLSTFLHEVTHHWCFFSAVGTTLAFLAMRARRRAVHARSADVNPEDELWGVLDDLVRYRVGTALLRPFAEGIALFAEFDALPSSSRVMSNTMTSATICFATGRNWDIARATPSGVGEEPLAGQALLSLLYGVRSQPAVAKRKTNLLLNPLRTGSTTGYLPGYLLVRNLWIESHKRNERLADTDLALQYLSSWMFNDYGLVALLLDPNVKDVSTIDPIIEYFTMRVQALVDANHQANLDKLELAADLPWLDESEAGDPDSAPNLGTDPDLWQLGRERFAAARRELDNEAASSPRQQQALARRDRRALAQRALLCLGRSNVEVRISPAGWATARAHDVTIYGGWCSDPNMFGRVGGGMLEAFLNPWNWGRYVAIVVSLAGQRVVTWTSRSLSEALQGQLDDFRANLNQIAVEDKQLDDFVTEYISPERDVIEIVEQSCEQEVNRFYTRLSLGFLSDNDFERCAIEMRDKKGFYAILGNVSLVRALAWISVVSQFGIRRDDYSAAFDEIRRFHRFEGSFSEALEAIRAIGTNKLGDPLVYDMGDAFFTTV
jgi:hypothetical protein